MLLNLKAKLIALAAALLTVLGFFLRLKTVTHQRDKAKASAEKYKAWSQRQSDTTKLDAEIENEFSDRKREADKAIKNDEIPPHLRSRR